MKAKKPKKKKQNQRDVRSEIDQIIDYKKMIKSSK